MALPERFITCFFKNFRRIDIRYGEYGSGSLHGLFFHFCLIEHPVDNFKGFGACFPCLSPKESTDRFLRSGIGRCGSSVRIAFAIYLGRI